MRPEAYRLGDLERWLWGMVPPSFALEAALRMAFLYLVLMVSMRAMGRRLSSQLSRGELIALVSLAAGIGPAVGDHGRGLLPATVAAAVIVAGQTLLSRATVRSSRLERWLQGRVTPVVFDGRIDLERLRENAVSRELLLAELRTQGVEQLGQVQRAFIEPDGSFTLVRAQVDASGLSAAPTWDERLRAEQPVDEEHVACEQCGAVEGARDRPSSCRFCASNHWASAVRS